MRRIMLCVASALVLVGGIGLWREARSQTATHTLQMTDPQIEAQLRLNSLACKAAGLDDNGVACANGQILNNALLEARKAKPPPPEPKKEP